MAEPTMTGLVKLISNAVAAMDAFCTAKETKLPSLDDPFTLQSEAIRMHPEMTEAVSVIVSAAAHLIAIVRPAPATLMTTAIQVHISSALRVAVDANIVEILRESGSEKGSGPSCQRNNPRFIEISPDIFANNRISSAMDTGKLYSEIIDKPDAKFDNTNGIAASVSYFTDEVVKSSAYLYESLTDPLFLGKSDVSHTPFNLAFKTNLPVFMWLSQSGNETRLKRFGIAFEGANKMMVPNAIALGFDWASLPKGSVVVDVGGGIGTESMTLAKAYKDLKFVVQDTQHVIVDGIEFFKQRLPKALESGQVIFQAHDFMTPQPISNARVYFLRMILHDWPDETCVEILKNLRKSAQPETELIIIECIMEYACPPKTIAEKDVPGDIGQIAPSPLLPNFGHARIFNYLIDVQMSIMLNSVERTVGQFAGLFKKSGWKMREVLRMPESPVTLHKIVATPE